MPERQDVGGWAAVQDDVQNLLASCCETVSNRLPGERSIGGRVWVIPRAVAERRAFSLTPTASISSATRLRDVVFGLQVSSKWLAPKMVPLAIHLGPFEERSGTVFRYGVGFVGLLTTGSLNGTDARSVDEVEIVHSSWGDLTNETKAHWRARDGRITLGRSLQQAQRLQRIYGTALGVQISLSNPDRKGPDLPGLGCITIHTPAGEELTRNQRRSARNNLLAFSSQIRTHLLQDLGYQPE